jgi:hypothetical protein
VLVLAAMLAACSDVRDPIELDEGTITVTNQTTVEWRNVTVTVNDHYTGTIPSIAPGGRMNASLSNFQTAFGQRYDRARQSVYKIEVTATDRNGNPVKLLWGAEKKSGLIRGQGADA